MKAIFILLALSYLLVACEKTADEIRAGKNAEARAERNKADHEKRK